MEKDEFEARLKALEDRFTPPTYPKVSSIQASGYLKEELDTFRKKDGKKETYEEIIWKLIWKVKEKTKGE